MSRQFETDDADTLIGLIRTAPLGAVIVAGDGEPEAYHIPFVYRQSDDAAARLAAHAPRSHTLFEQARRGSPCLVIFGGADGYISPSWYATKARHGRVVPTWNYSVVHVHGRLRVVDDGQWVREQLAELTDIHERDRAEPWSMDDAPADYTERLILALVGIEVVIERMSGTVKASQNQPKANQASVLDALAVEQPESELAGLMRSVLDGR